MARGERNGHNLNAPERSASKARFTKWEIAEAASEEPHTLASLGPVTVTFTVQIDQPINKGHHGCALFNHERQLIWAWATDGLKLGIGEHHLRYVFPMLPVRPGPYSWEVSIYEDRDLLDFWECVPEMIVAADIHQHALDQWNGILNMPTRFAVNELGKVRVPE
jgi:hypothetical protein